MAYKEDIPDLLSFLTSERRKWHERVNTAYSVVKGDLIKEASDQNLRYPWKKIIQLLGCKKGLYQTINAVINNNVQQDAGLLEVSIWDNIVQGSGGLGEGYCSLVNKMQMMYFERI